MFLTKLWILPDNPPKEVDCLVVISYAVKNSKVPNNPTRNIIDLAYSLYKQFPKSFLIMSTGDNQKLGIPNSKIMKDYAIKIGIDKSKIIEENRSLNTYENIIFSEKIIKERKFRHVTFATLDLHSRRVKAIANNLELGNYNLVSTYAKGDISYGPYHHQTRFRVTIFIYEILAYIYNYLKGQI